MLALTVAGPKVVGAGVIMCRVRVSLEIRVGLEDVGVAGDVDEGEEGQVKAGVGLEVGVEVVLAEAWKQSP